MKRAVELLQGLSVLVLFQGLGEALVRFGGVPVPGPVAGLFLLLLALQLIDTDHRPWLAASAFQLIRYLSLLFLPAAVGMFFLGDLLTRHWLAIAAAIAVATPLSIALTALLMRWLLTGRRHG
ncbi:MAG: CidA/LrgA family protein [Porticoccaceae bacterium]|jgi:holin-like protein